MKKNAKLGNDVVPNYCAAYLINLKMCESMTVFIATCITGPAFKLPYFYAPFFVNRKQW